MTIQITGTSSNHYELIQENGTRVQMVDGDQAEAVSEAFHVGVKFGKHYAYLDSVRDIVSGIIADPTPGLEASVKDEIVRLREQANRCIRLLMDQGDREVKAALQAGRTHYDNGKDERNDI